MRRPPESRPIRLGFSSGQTLTLGATRAEAEMFMMAAILTGSWFCVCRSESDLSPLFATQPLTVPRFRGQRSFRVVQISNQIAGNEAPAASETVSFDFFSIHRFPRCQFFLAAKNRNPWFGGGVIWSRDLRNHGLKVNSWYRKQSGIESMWTLNRPSSSN